jgi:hypothetical protein
METGLPFVLFSNNSMYLKLKPQFSSVRDSSGNTFFVLRLRQKKHCSV